MSEHVEIVVIGGGQAGLAVGYHLRQRGLQFVILDQNDRVGDSWRNRWDSLRLFTPARYSSLPGMDFLGRASAFPSKDDAAEYLAAYAEAFGLSVRSGVKVDRMSSAGDRFQISTTAGVLTAGRVVVATGSYQRPRIPPFAHSLGRAVLQFHSSAYRNPEQLREGGTLVVGAGNSGAEIAMDIADHGPTWLSGPDTGREPTRAGSLADRVVTPLLWIGATRLTVDTFAGRKLRDRFLNPPRGIPLARVRARDLAAAGVERVGRTVGVEGGFPLLDDCRALEVSNVIWCTGYTPDFDWIDLPLQFDRGYPRHDRGVVTSPPGLYFVGLQFLYSLSSALLGGVGRDAAHIVDNIVAGLGQQLPGPVRARKM